MDHSVSRYRMSAVKDSHELARSMLAELQALHAASVLMQNTMAEAGEMQQKHMRKHLADLIDKIQDAVFACGVARAELAFLEAE